MSNALRIVTNFYAGRTAERSGVPLINHIHEGLAILDVLGAAEATKDAYCLHPLFQADDDLRATSHSGVMWSKTHKDVVTPWIVLLIMEYRNQANAWLSDKVADESVYSTIDPGRAVSKLIKVTNTPTPGPLPEVRQMLIADKVQNYKDFLKYHKATHPRSGELEVYFRTWHQAPTVFEETNRPGDARA